MVGIKPHSCGLRATDKSRQGWPVLDAELWSATGIRDAWTCAEVGLGVGDGLGDGALDSRQKDEWPDATNRGGLGLGIASGEGLGTWLRSTQRIFAWEPVAMTMGGRASASDSAASGWPQCSGKKEGRVMLSTSSIERRGTGC
jgi:hypothetical protein